MAELVADFMLKRLRDWGVRRIYGYPGDGINGFIGALRPRRTATRSSSRCATRRWRRSWPAPTRSSPARSASASPPPGPGAIHLLNGLYDAKLDHQPVVAIVGQQARAALGGELPAGGRPASRSSRTSRTSTCRWRRDPAQMRHLVDRAIRIALDAAHGHLPHRPERRARRRRSRRRRASTARSTRASATRGRGSSPSEDDLRARGRGAERGREGRDAGRPGRARRGRRGGRRSPTCSARASRRRCSARPSLPDDLPFVTGSIGLLGTQAELGADEGLRHAADGRLELPVLGVPAEGGPGARRADRPRRRACSAIRYPMEVNLVGDARETLRALLPLLERKDGPLLAGGDRARASRDWWELMERARA